MILSKFYWTFGLYYSQPNRKKNPKIQTLEKLSSQGMMTMWETPLSDLAISRYDNNV